MAEGKWHRGSRYYRIGAWALGIAGAICVLTIFRVPGAVPEAIGMYGGVAAVLLGGAGVVNYRERGVEQARVEATDRAAERADDADQRADERRDGL